VGRKGGGKKISSHQEHLPWGKVFGGAVQGKLSCNLYGSISTKGEFFLSTERFITTCKSEFRREKVGNNYGWERGVSSSHGATCAWSVYFGETRERGEKYQRKKEQQACCVSRQLIKKGKNSVRRWGRTYQGTVIKHAYKDGLITYRAEGSRDLRRTNSLHHKAFPNENHHCGARGREGS